MIPLSYYLACVISLYLVGLYCLVAKRNMIRLVMGIEILINAANLNFIALSLQMVKGYIDPLAHTFVIISIGIAGCVTAVALTLVVHAYRHYGTLDIRKIRRLKG